MSTSLQTKQKNGKNSCIFSELIDNTVSSPPMLFRDQVITADELEVWRGQTAEHGTGVPQHHACC